MAGKASKIHIPLVLFHAKSQGPVLTFTSNGYKITTLLAAATSLVVVPTHVFVINIVIVTLVITTIITISILIIIILTGRTIRVRVITTSSGVTMWTGGKCVSKPSIPIGIYEVVVASVLYELV